jgi:hypothetical protein
MSWSNGILEYWNIGILKTRGWWNEICFYNGMGGEKNKIRSKSGFNFQSSIIPSFHHSKFYLMTNSRYGVIWPGSEGGHGMLALQQHGC